MLRQGGQSNLLRLPQQKPIMEWLTKSRNAFLQVFGTGKTEKKGTSILVSGENPLPGAKSAIFPLTWWETQSPLWGSRELIPCGLSLRDEDKCPRKAGPRKVSVLSERHPLLFLEFILALILYFGFCFKM